MPSHCCVRPRANWTRSALSWSSRRAIDGELANLGKAVAAGGQLPMLIALIWEREQQRQQAAAVNQMRDVGQLNVKRIERDLRTRVKEWRALLGRQVPVARQIVTKLLDSRPVFTPREDRSYEFSGRVSLGGLLQGKLSMVRCGVP